MPIIERSDAERVARGKGGASSTRARSDGSPTSATIVAPLSERPCNSVSAGRIESGIGYAVRVNARPMHEMHEGAAQRERDASRRRWWWNRCRLAGG